MTTAETSQGDLRMRRTNDGAVICERVAMGESFSQRFLGLMGRGSMDPEEGLFLATSSIHMMFMRFPIDALFVDKPDDSGARRVVGVRENLPPWRGIVMPVPGAKAVIELPAGTLERHGVTTNDVVILEATDATSKPEVSAA